LVEPFLQLVGQRDVLDLKALEREPEVGEDGPGLRRHRRGERVLIGGHVEKRDLALAEVVRERRHDRAPKLTLDVGDRIALARARHFEEEGARVADLVAVDAVRTEAYRAELTIADGQRARGAPRLIEAKPRREEVDLALER